MKTILILALSLSFQSVILGAHVRAKDRVVKLIAEVGTGSPNPGIILRWPSEVDASNYEVWRKLKTATTWGAAAVAPNLGATATSWTDTSVAVGQAFEYKVIKSTTRGYTAKG